MAGIHWAGLTAAVALLALGCGDSVREEAEGERRTAELVVGTSAAEWSLLTLPLPGGTADLRPVVSPDSVVWTGDVEIPLATGAWRVGDESIVLRAEDGRVLRYDPVADDLAELESVPAGARAIAGASSVVFIDPPEGFAYEVGPDFDQSYELPDGVTWAGSLEGGLAALSNDDRFWLLPRSDSSSVVERTGFGRPPALVTAWGRRLAVTAPDGRSVRVYALDGDPELIDEARLDGVVRTLSASPSSHEIYAAVGDPPRLRRISRFSFDVEDVARLPGAADDVRPGLFGGSILVRTGAGSVRIPTGSDATGPLGGDWRVDLPLGLPGDLSIISVDEEARLVSVVDTGGVALAGGSPRWWIPVRYNPTVGQLDEIADAMDDMGAAAEGDARRPEGATDDEADEDDAADDLDMPDVAASPDAALTGPPGYYAIVTSARQRAGVEELTASLEDAGYPSRIQTYPDEAGEVWHRGLVGPYPTRARAQAAARQLLRERGLQAWVTEIGASE